VKKRKRKDRSIVRNRHFGLRAEPRYPRLRVGQSKGCPGNAVNLQGCAVGFVCGAERILRKEVSDGYHMVVKRIFPNPSGKGKAFPGPYANPVPTTAIVPSGEGAERQPPKDENP
jgi:hypothetical protein